jgi:hypothetical protein
MSSGGAHREEAVVVLPYLFFTLFLLAVVLSHSVPGAHRGRHATGGGGAAVNRTATTWLISPLQEGLQPDHLLGQNLRQGMVL